MANKYNVQFSCLPHAIALPKVLYLKKLEIKKKQTSEESCILQVNLGKAGFSNFFIQKGGGSNEVVEGITPNPTVCFPNRFLALTEWTEEQGGGTPMFTL